jgi:hypothetical protein
MHKIRTSVLFASGILALVIGMMGMGTGAAIRPVRDATGAVVYQRPGRILMEPDYWADIRRDWPAYLALFIAACLFIWCFIRLIRYFYRRFHATP